MKKNNDIKKIIEEVKEIETKQLGLTNLENFKNKNIMTFGTFDLFHVGHKKIIEHAKKIAGDNSRLFIGVSSDKWNRLKGKISKEDQNIRRRKVLEEYPGAFVFFEDHDKPEESWPELWDKHDIDLIVMGGDHSENLSYINDKTTPKGSNMNIVFYERTPKISSTLLRSGIK